MKGRILSKITNSPCLPCLKFKFQSNFHNVGRTKAISANLGMLKTQKLVSVLLFSNLIMYSTGLISGQDGEDDYSETVNPEVEALWLGKQE